ncbi:MAG: DNA recombination protein RmuC [Muribaculum sp.]|nr:DNA recombination protein RmuC [Muribaculaceae bacterium]MCM1080512.1 DNA recombination protein RmuC [Muribaculum sp.]
MITTIILAIATLLIGVAVTYMILENRHKRLINNAEQERMRAEKAETALQVALAKAESEQQMFEKSAEARQQTYNAQIQALRDQIQSERAAAEQLRRESSAQWTEKFETLKQEIKASAGTLLADKQKALQSANKTQMEQLLEPVREQFAAFKKSVDDQRTQSEVNKKELQNSFEAALKLLWQQQETVVKNLGEQSQRIGQDAAQLSKALRGDSKVQGDWGEMVLESMLEGSGLRRDYEYFIQGNVKDAEGNNLRPDVVVRFPEGRSVIIDSKVSLTAYTAAVNTDDDEVRRQMLREHVRSVRRHIDELADKNYSALVDDAIGYVLMFMPIENSYIAAMKQQPDLSQYAYSKHIILISPSNLMMALQLAYNLWQYDRQGKNVENIIKTAADLYDKVTLFEDAFNEIGQQIADAEEAFNTARKRLYTGNGNVMRRVDSLRSLGVTPKKQIKGLQADE